MCSHLLRHAQSANVAAPDVILTGSKLKLNFKIANHPGTAWKHYDFPLAAAKGWHISGEMGRAATGAELQEVLGSLQQLWIRGEYREGEDTGKLDNVVLGR